MFMQPLHHQHYGAVYIWLVSLNTLRYLLVIGLRWLLRVSCRLTTPPMLNPRPRPLAALFPAVQARRRRRGMIRQLIRDAPIRLD
jgi:hypothetical protein